jgi:hypothetical protein
MKKLRYAFVRVGLLLLIVGCLLYVPAQKSSEAEAAANCCTFCWAQYEQCINNGGDENFCNARLCACMTGCHICPVCE